MHVRGRSMSGARIGLSQGAGVGTGQGAGTGLGQSRDGTGNMEEQGTRGFKLDASVQEQGRGETDEGKTGAGRVVQVETRCRRRAGGREGGGQRTW